ncbi:hypothetical protein CRU92_03950 [Arcobacter sp. FW59]|nr:hypothetical protein CRU92_03950 [Arcobacter sp. FW59]
MNYIKISIIVFLFSTIVNASSLLPVEKSLITGKLENGFEYTIKKNEKPDNRASIRLLVKAGSLEEDDDQKGVAHLVEHMAFNGTKHFKGNDLIKFLESLGVSFGGHLNASTSTTQTMYQLDIPLEKDNLEKAMLIFSDWAGRIDFTQEELDKERGVVQEEARARNDIRFRLSQQSKDILYANSKYKDRTPIGDMKIIENISLERVKAFYDDWYRPELMHFVIVGDFDVKKVESLIKNSFKDFKNNSKRELSSRDVPLVDGTRFIISSDKELVSSSLGLSFYDKAEKLLTKDDYKDALIQSIVLRLVNQKAQEQKLKDNPIAKSISLRVGSLGENLGSYNFMVSYDENKDLQSFEELLKFIYTIDNLGFQKDDFIRIVKDMKISNKESLKTIKNRLSNSYADMIVQYISNDNLFVDEEYSIELKDELLDEITLDDIIKKYSEILDITSRIVSFTTNNKNINETDIKSFLNRPKKDFLDKEVYNQKVLPKTIVLENELKPVKIINEEYDKKYDFYKFSLENGINILYKFNNYTKNTVSLEAFSKGGFSIYENINDLTNAKFAVDVISKSGFNGFNILEVSKIYSGKTVKVNANIGRYYETINGTSSTKDFKYLLESIYLISNKFQVDDTILNNTKNNTISALKKDYLNPSKKFSDELINFTYINNLMFKPIEEKDVELVNKDDILKIYQNRFSDLNNFNFVIVGDIHKDEVKKYIEKYFGNLPTSSRNESYNFNEVKPLIGEQNFIRNYNNQNISSISLSFSKDLPYSIEETFYLAALSDVLSTKLREEIREEKSGVYGISVKNNFAREPYERASISISFTCDPKRKDELVADIKRIITDIQNKSVNIKYIDSFVKKRLLSFKDGKKGSRFWLNHLKNIYLYDESLDNIEKYETIYKSINPELINKMANKYLNLDEIFYTELNPKAE